MDLARLDLLDCAILHASLAVLYDLHGIYSCVVGNLTGNIFVNNFLLQGGGTLEFIGIWYLMLGRRTATATAFLLAGTVSAIMPGMMELKGM